MQFWVEHVGRHFRSSPEVKKEIEIFKDNLSNQNLYHIISSVFKCPEQLTPPEIEVSISGYLKNKFQIQFLIFNALNLLYYSSVSLDINIYC